MDDRFFIVIETRDPRFNATANTKSLLEKDWRQGHRGAGGLNHAQRTTSSPPSSSSLLLSVLGYRGTI
jgi:hypothetical protein